MRIGCHILLFFFIFPQLLMAEESLPEKDGSSWLPTAALLGYGVCLMMTQDEATRDWVLEHRGEGEETFADIVRPYGEWPVFVTAGVGLTLAGLATRDDQVRIAGERVALSIAISAVIEGAAKYSLSRHRPGSADGWDDFEFFSTHSSMPSGHATVAFALAKSLSDDINRRWASVALYTTAAASSWARLIDDMHWLSDLGLGAVAGYYSAKLVTSRILAPHRQRNGTQGPELALAPGGLGVVWRF